MSFEGFYQVICANNHEYEFDVYCQPDDTSCPHCKADSCWWNICDETNGAFDEDGITRIDGYIELELLEESKMCVCKECNNIHTISARKVKVPDTGGHKGKLTL